MPTTQTETPVTGVDGRIKNRTGGQDVVLSLINEWKIKKTVGVAKSHHFESPANAHGAVFPTKKYAATGDWTVSIKGFFNRNTTSVTQGSQTGFGDGADVIVDLVVSKGGAVGYPSCAGIIKDFETGPTFGDELQSFTCTLDGYGTPPTFGAIT